MTPTRQRLPTRRPSETVTLVTDGLAFEATVGFDEHDHPREVFLNGGKEGSLFAAVLSDTAVVVSVALQHGVSAAALAKSVGRLSDKKLPASPIGAALDLLMERDA